MYNHQPENYQCPFCTIVSGGETSYNKRSDIVYENDKTVAFISPKWWVNNPGNVIVTSKKHVENIYDIPDDLLSTVYITTKKVAIAIKEAYKCDGTSMRQHNEPAGNQDLWHFHVHVFPRYANDKLYQNTDNYRLPSVEERLIYAEKLQSYFNKKKAGSH